MADNLNVPGGSAGPAATDDIAGVHYQRIKLIHGADGVNAGDVSTANRYPTETTSSSVVGSGTQATAQRVTLATDGTVIGAVGETAPASDTASSGLNGRLQRIAQRITSLIAQIPATLGQKAMTASLAVVVASDQSDIPVILADATIQAISSYYAPRRTGANVGAGQASYLTGVAVGDIQTVADVARTKASNVKSITVYYGAGTPAAINVWMFGGNPTASTFVDGSAASLHANDVDKVAGTKQILSTEFVGIVGGHSATVALDWMIPASNDAYVVLVAAGTFAPSDVDTVGFVLGVQLDG